MIALPAFLTQRAKGEDLEAQLTVRTAVTALETYHTDHDTFDATRRRAVEIEPALGEARELVSSATDALVLGSPRRRTPARSSRTRAPPPAPTERTCDRHGHGGCRDSADAAGNWW